MRIIPGGMQRIVILFDGPEERVQKYIDFIENICLIPEDMRLNGSITVHFSKGIPVKLEKKEVVTL